MATSAIPDVLKVDDFFMAFDFTKDGVIGTGMTGQVVKASSNTDPDLRRAVKIFQLCDGSERDIYKRDVWNFRQEDLFYREVDILKKLHHRNVMSMLVPVKCPTYMAIVMAYCDNGTLHDKIPTLNSTTSRRYFRQVCRAVEYIHRKKIFHADIKPENMLINSQDEAMLADFGLSHQLPDHDAKLVVNFGTPAFMAPEAWSGKEVKPYKVDLYALGVTLWCMTLKRTPSKEVNYLEEVDECASNIPVAHWCVLNDLLDSDPDQRPNATQTPRLSNSKHESPKKQLRQPKTGSRLPAAKAAGCPEAVKELATAQLLQITTHVGPAQVYI